MKTWMAVACVVVGLISGSWSQAAPAANDVDPKALYQSVDRIPHLGLTEQAWRQAQKKAALEALGRIKGTVGGEDFYYLAGLELFAEQWREAAEHLKAYLAIPISSDADSKQNHFFAGTKLQDAFVKGNLIKEGEAYYSANPISLGIFYSRLHQLDRSLQVYESYLATHPGEEDAKRVRSLIIYALEDKGNPDEVARRLEQYREGMTANSLVNAYSAASRMYAEAGNQERYRHYTNLVLEMGKNSKEGKAVDGPVYAHVEWVIKGLEEARDAAALNAFMHQVHTELAGNKAVMDHLSARETFNSIVNQPAKELVVDHFLNGSPTTLKQLRGRVVLLDFFAHWCGPCVAGFPGVRALQKKYESRGLTVLGVSGIYGFYKGQRGLSEEQEMDRMKSDFVKEYQVTWPMLFSKSRTNDKNYGVGYIPQLVLIDPQGIIRYAIIGKGYEDGLEKEVAGLLRGAVETKRK